MAQPVFEDILNTPVEDIERPKPVPTGHYVAVVNGLPERGKSEKKQTDFIRFKMKFVGAEEDVDQEALEEAGGLDDLTMDLTFYITQKSGYRCKDFLVEDLGLEPDKGDGLWDLAQKANGAQCLVQVRQKPTVDGKGMWSEIASTAPLES